MYSKRYLSGATLWNCKYVSDIIHLSQPFISYFQVFRQVFEFISMTYWAIPIQKH